MGSWTSHKRGGDTTGEEEIDATGGDRRKLRNGKLA
jgi:hypothetical protein